MSHLARGPMPGMGIDSKASAPGRRQRRRTRGNGGAEAGA